MDFFRFFLKRLLQAIPVIFGLTLVTFFMIRAIPGDPAVILLGRHATAERIAAFHQQMGLDKPVTVQYLYFLRDISRGELGHSLLSQEPVTTLIARRVQITLFLIAYSTVLAIIIAVPMATLAALNKDRLPDQTVRGVFMVTMAMPNFWIGIILMLVFSLTLRILPVSGFGDNFFENLRHLFLPAFTTALYLSALAIRSLRNSILDALEAEHVAFARAKGLPERLVFAKHVLRNGLISTVTVLGITVGWMYGSSAVIERVFSVPGAGLLLIDSVFRRDYPVIMGLVLLFGIMTVLTNFLVDVIYAILDPRVRL